jgi:uncharacterized protein (DUF342 family)
LQDTEQEIKDKIATLESNIEQINENTEKIYKELESLKDSNSKGLSDNFKSEELHKASLNAFITNQISFDNLIITLCIGILGFMLSISIKYFTYSGTTLDGVMIVFYIISIVSLLSTIGVVLNIFTQNKKYLEAILQEKSQNRIKKLSLKLKKLDKVVKWLFGISIFFSINIFQNTQASGR